MPSSGAGSSGLVGFDPAPGVEPGLDGKLPQLRLRCAQGAHHRRDERVFGVSVERVEPVAEAAEGDRVERQTRHVGGDIDVVVRVDPAPLVHELLGEVEHHRQVVAHGPHAERREQDAVRSVPERVVGVGGEQAVAGAGLPHVREPARDRLVESGVVADLLDEAASGHKNPCPPGDHELEDRTVLAGHRHESLDGILPVDAQDVAEDGEALRTR